MKKHLNIVISFSLIVSILFGYAGVPLSKMICSEDGHVEVSLSQTEEVKSCCAPIETSDDCCDYAHAFFKIYTNTLVQQIKDKTNHDLLQVAFTFHQSNNFSVNTFISQTKPEMQEQQRTLSFFQVFRI